MTDEKPTEKKRSSRTLGFYIGMAAAMAIAGCGGRRSKPKSAAVAPARRAPRFSPPDEAVPPVKKPPGKLAALVSVAFTGSFTAKGDTRRAICSCSHCKRVLAGGIVAECPGCGARLAWPKSVRCGFCNGKKCSTCQGSGKCHICGNAPRMLMGVRAPCDACNTTGRCGAYGGKKTSCSFCNNGWWTPPKAKKPRP